MDKLARAEIIVRRAHTNEKLTTLDGDERTLEETMLVIADGERATAIAGVMGSRDSEVSETTTNVLLECALFEPKQVRRTRTALGLSTDASYRFERGVDESMMETAVRRAVELIVRTAGGAVAGAADVYPVPGAPRTISVRPARVAHVLGVSFTKQQLANLLEPIGFDIDGDRPDLVVAVPAHRIYDVEREIDVIEEITRRHGYNNFPTELLPFRPSVVPEDALAQLESRLRELLVARGFLEARLAPLAPDEEGDVALLHPLSSAESKLRRALLPGLFKRAEYNLNRGVRNIRLFEIGTTFAPNGQLPNETTRMAAVFTGARLPPHWTGSSAEYDIWDMKGIVAEIADAVGIPFVTQDVVPGIAPSLESVFSERARLGGMSADGNAQILGGRLRSDYIDAPAWAGEFFGFELRLPDQGYTGERVTYAQIAQFPGIEQDLALVIPEATTAATIETTIRNAGGVYLEDVAPFDLYRGAGIPAGSRSIAYRLRFRAADRTLTDEEADAAVRKILTRLKDEHGVERRG